MNECERSRPGRGRCWGSSAGLPTPGPPVEDGDQGKTQAATDEQELQGHVLVALGKIALQDSSLASKVGLVFRV